MEILIVILYLIMIFGIAYFSKIKASNNFLETQYLANKSLNFKDAIGSIIATEVSALTFLGLPAYSFSKDFSFLHIYLGAIIGRLFIAYIELPLIYNKTMTLYSFIVGVQGSTDGSRKAVTGIYLVTKILSVGVRLYAGSILVSELFGTSIYISILSTLTLTFIYTFVGGLKAVVRTDALQMLVFILGAIAAHLVIFKSSDIPIGELFENAYKAQKFQLLSFNNISIFFVGVIGGIIFDFGTHGMDQDYIQRLLACKNLKTAQKTIIYSSFLSIFVAMIFLSLGAFLWSHNEEVQFATNVSGDKIFAHFITLYFPAPLKGLMLAGVLAATMSTLDSTINAMSSCLSIDIFKRNTDLEIKKGVFRDSILISFLLFVVAIFASKYDGILVLGLKIASWSAGSLITFFISQTLLKKYFKPLRAYRVLFSYGVSLLFVAFNSFVIAGAWQLNVYYGVSGGALGLYLIGKIKK